MAAFAVLLVLDIRLPASGRISMRNRFVYDEWINFSSIMLTFLYLSITIENVSVTSKALVGDNGSTLCSMVSGTSGSVKEIVVIAQKICYVDVHDA